MLLYNLPIKDPRMLLKTPSSISEKLFEVIAAGRWEISNRNASIELSIWNMECPWNAHAIRIRSPSEDLDASPGSYAFTARTSVNNPFSISVWVTSVGPGDPQSRQTEKTEIAGDNQSTIGAFDVPRQHVFIGRTASGTRGKSCDLVYHVRLCCPGQR